MRLQEDAANFPSVARLNASRGVTCWEDDQNGDYLQCATLTLTLGGTALSMGATTTVWSYMTMFPSVMGLDETSAVVCYYDASWGRARCTPLVVGSDGSLTTGTTVEVYSSSLCTSYRQNVATTALDSTHGAVCVKLSGGYTYCYVLTLSGSSLSVGSYFIASYSSNVYFLTSITKVVNFL